MLINPSKAESLLKIPTQKLEATPFDNFFKHKHFIISGTHNQTQLLVFSGAPHTPLINHQLSSKPIHFSWS